MRRGGEISASSSFQLEEELAKVGRGLRQLKYIHVVALLKLSLFHKKYESLDLSISRCLRCV